MMLVVLVMVSVVMMMMMLVEVDDVGGCVGDYCYGDDECGVLFCLCSFAWRVASYFVLQVENADNFKNKIILNEHRLCASSITVKLQNDQLGTLLHCACMYTCI